MVEGELIDTMGKGRRHSKTQRNVLLVLGKLFGENYVESEPSVEIQGKFDLSEPQPDIVCLKADYRTFDQTLQAGDIHLIVEISDSTLTFDLSTKAKLYASGPIAEC